MSQAKISESPEQQSGEPQEPPQSLTKRRTSGKTRQQPGSACSECQSRKLRCDRQQPKCGVCVSSGVPCHIRAVCPPRGPKKGHLKVLRNQIAELESRLDSHEKRNLTNPTLPRLDGDGGVNLDTVFNYDYASTSTTGTTNPLAFGDGMWSELLSHPDSLDLPTVNKDEGFFDVGGSMMNPPRMDSNAVDMCLTGMICVDLDQMYFDRVHSFAPMIQKDRYLSWSKEANKSKARVCLQHTMWIMAASLSSQFRYLQDSLYVVTRQMLEELYMDDSKTELGCLERTQAWILITLYELMCNKYQRGLISAGRALRLTQLQHLYEIDAASLMGNEKVMDDFVEAESARRTFWIAYIIDPFIGLNDGLPLTLNEQEIRTRLPADETDFQKGQYAVNSYLQETIVAAAKQMGNSSFPALTECIIVATTCGRSLAHKERSIEEQSHGGVTQEFLRRHQWLDTILTAQIKSLSMRSALSVAETHDDATLVFAKLAAYTLVLFLYTVIELVPSGTGDLQPLLLEYRTRALSASQEVCKLAASIRKLDYFQTHPLMPIPLLMCAKFILVRAESDEDRNPQLQEIANALESLKDVSKLADEYLQFIKSNEYLQFVKLNRPETMGVKAS